MAGRGRSLRCSFLYCSLPSSSLRDALCNARFLARSLPSGPSQLRSGLPSDFSAIAFRLAYRELYEWRGEAVRCAATLCIARLLARSLRSDLLLLRSVYFFFAQGMCLYLLWSGFSVGLRLAKTTETCAKITEACAKITETCAMPR